ncbi:CpsD/CapB family tyrosine-protein kinase (plasmid) [Ruegeria conchae]|uniref:CpsD/CapB family tyrosine-protein kinase n=1 Tax=Ruegeria conchae TaxID=981384 RepID=UPI00147DBE56|nr:CpsD/CapB family tyrosine-protein kinase [Ruegeria conchae]UWR05151.1 CpsD/CapB family tyrosine-protein kinase [Ruegeria conchae]
MERIQTAIQKAREARRVSDAEKKEQTSAPTPVETLQPEGSPASLKEKLWADLPKYKLNPKQLMRARISGHEATTESVSFDVLRTRMMHQMQSNNWRRVAIASPGSACGKTTLCLNLAFSFARQRNTRVILVDLDLRRPSIHKLLQTGEYHFAKALEGESQPEDHIVCYDEKLAFALNSHSVPESAELLQDKDAAHVIDRMEERYQPDIMLFDTPPMLTCDDTYAFLDQIDCVLLVAAAENSTAEELEKCKDEISARCNLLGVVLNKCRYLETLDKYGY